MSRDTRDFQGFLDCPDLKGTRGSACLGCPDTRGSWDPLDGPDRADFPVSENRECQESQVHPEHQENQEQLENLDHSAL